MVGRLEGDAGGTGGSPFTVEGAGGYAIGTGGGANESFVGTFGAFASMAARSDEGGGRLGEIGWAGELTLSEPPPTIAIGAGTREGESGDVPGLSPSAPKGDVMLFASGTIGTSEELAPRPDGLLGGGAGAGAPVSRWRCSFASACWKSFGSDAWVSASSRPLIEGCGGRGGWLAGRGGAAVVLTDSGSIVTFGALRTSAGSASDTRGGSGALGLRVGMARAPAGGAWEADRGSMRETSFEPPWTGGS